MFQGIPGFRMVEEYPSCGFYFADCDCSVNKPVDMSSRIWLVLFVDGSGLGNQGQYIIVCWEYI